jgi:predicted transcriptional regulator
MEDTLTININSELKVLLLEMAETEAISLDIFVNQAIKDYLFIRKFRTMRSQMIEKQEKAYTDEQIFEIIS